MIKPLITMKEVREVLKCTAMTLCNYRRQGRLKCVKIGGRLYMTEAELKRIMAKGLPPPTAAYRRKTRLDMRARRAAKAEKKGEG